MAGLQRWIYNWGDCPLERSNEKYFKKWKKNGKKVKENGERRFKESYASLQDFQRVLQGLEEPRTLGRFELVKM